MNTLIKLVKVAIAFAIILSSRGARGQEVEGELRLTPHTFERNEAELHLRLYNVMPKNIGFDIAGLRAVEGSVGVVGINKEFDLRGIKLRPGIYAWLEPKNIKPTVGVSGGYDGTFEVEGQAVFAGPKEAFGHIEVTKKIWGRLGAGTTGELHPEILGRREWGLGPHIILDVKAGKLYACYIRKFDGGLTAEQFEPARNPWQWKFGIDFAARIPKRSKH